MANKKKSSEPEEREFFPTGVEVDEESGQVVGSGDGTSADFTGAGSDGAVEEEEDPDE